MRKPTLALLLIPLLAIVLLSGCPEEGCKDSDGGFEPYNYGYIETEPDKFDYCETDTLLVEYFCDEFGESANDYYDCAEDGAVCAEGECRTSPECSPGESAPCSTGIPGVCAEGIMYCNGQDYWGDCEQDMQPSAELCDDFLDNDCDGNIDYADSDCGEILCGNGAIDEGEECDDGFNNNNMFADNCRLNCKNAYCGDGIADSAEECDNGGDNGDWCSQDCKLDYAKVSQDKLDELYEVQQAIEEEGLGWEAGITTAYLGDYPFLEISEEEQEENYITGKVITGNAVEGEDVYECIDEDMGINELLPSKTFIFKNGFEDFFIGDACSDEEHLIEYYCKEEDSEKPTSIEIDCYEKYGGACIKNAQGIAYCTGCVDPDEESGDWPRPPGEPCDISCKTTVIYIPYKNSTSEGWIKSYTDTCMDAGKFTDTGYILREYYCDKFWDDQAGKYYKLAGDRDRQCACNGGSCACANDGGGQPNCPIDEGPYDSGICIDYDSELEEDEKDVITPSYVSFSNQPAIFFDECGGKFDNEKGGKPILVETYCGPPIPIHPDGYLNNKRVNCSEINKDYTCLKSPKGAYCGPRTKFDWRSADIGQGKKNYVTSIKNQGHCRSCWAFATIASVESAHIIKSGAESPMRHINLSEKELVSCCGSCGDCFFGSANVGNSFNYILTQEIHSEACLPYDCKNRLSCVNECDFDERCMEHEELFKFSLDAIQYDIPYTSENNYLELKKEILTGPVVASIAVYCNSNGKKCSIASYKKGVYQRTSGEVPAGFHTITIIGWDDNMLDKNGKKAGAWLIKNSIGTDWGENGFGWIAYAENFSNFLRPVLN